MEGPLRRVGRGVPTGTHLGSLRSASEAGIWSFSRVITGSLVSIIPLVVAFLFLQRYWQSGLATGGVKQ